MSKFIVLAMVMVSMVGCASTKDVDSLRNRVSALEAAHQVHAAQHSTIVSDHEAIKGEHTDLNAKFDRVFTKANTK